MHVQFQVHRLSPYGLICAGQIARDFDELLTKLEETIGTEGREMALVRTKLEEACFYAKKALAVNPGNQEPEVR